MSIISPIFPECQKINSELRQHWFVLLHNSFCVTVFGREFQNLSTDDDRGAILFNTSLPTISITNSLFQGHCTPEGQGAVLNVVGLQSLAGRYQGSNSTANLDHFLPLDTLPAFESSFFQTIITLCASLSKTRVSQSQTC
jgi:hypothetical protein